MLEINALCLKTVNLKDALKDFGFDPMNKINSPASDYPNWNFCLVLVEKELGGDVIFSPPPANPNPSSLNLA